MSAQKSIVFDSTCSRVLILLRALSDVLKEAAAGVYKHFDSGVSQLTKTIMKGKDKKIPHYI